MVEERDASQALTVAEVDGDGVTPAADAAAPEGSVLDQLGTRHFNYQPGTTAIPDGWMADTGRAFGQRSNGLIYAWDVGGTPADLAAAHSRRHTAWSVAESETLCFCVCRGLIRA